MKPTNETCTCGHEKEQHADRRTGCSYCIVCKHYTPKGKESATANAELTAPCKERTTSSRPMPLTPFEEWLIGEKKTPNCEVKVFKDRGAAIEAVLQKHRELCHPKSEAQLREETLRELIKLCDEDECDEPGGVICNQEECFKSGICRHILEQKLKEVGEE